MEKTTEELLRDIKAQLDDIQEDNREDTYIIKTTDSRRAKLLTNVDNLVKVICDLDNLRRDLYKGREYYKVYNMEKGKGFVGHELKDLDIPEGKSIRVVDEEYVIDKILSTMEENNIFNILEDYM